MGVVPHIPMAAGLMALATSVVVVFGAVALTAQPALAQPSAVAGPMAATGLVAPSFTSINAATFAAGYAGEFAISTEGSPPSALSEVGVVPAGVIFVDNHDGTATLQGSPSSPVGGLYHLIITAANSTGAVVQGFTLMVIPWSPTMVLVGGSRSPLYDPGNSGDGGPLAAATFGSPSIAMDSAGNMYIADVLNNRVRKVATNGIVTNFAGDAAGSRGNSGDGGPATSARLNRPIAVVADRAGNVYVADGENRRVREVNVEGIITNFAGSAAQVYGTTGDGGPATAATLVDPEALAVDASGDVYIADTGGQQVRKVDRNSIITTLAGSPKGQYGAGNGGDGGPATASALHNPDGLAVDPAGDVYIADAANNRVRKVAPDGIITNWAGNADGTPGDTGDGGPATAATLSGPAGLTFDAVGDLYIGDDEYLRKVDAAGTITAFAGSAHPLDSFVSGDEGPASLAQLSVVATVAIDPAGGVFIAQGDQVHEFVTAPSITSRPATNFTVGVRGTYWVNAAGMPPPVVVESGTLPAGLAVTIGSGMLTISGTPAQGTRGTYPITFQLSGQSGVRTTQAFTLTVHQAVFTYPQSGETDVDATKPFQWSTISEATGYLVTIGTTQYGVDLANSGVVPAGASFYWDLPPLPLGRTLYATLYAEVNGTWTSYQAITFVAYFRGTFTTPLDKQTGADPTAALQWTTNPEAQGYILTVGTKPYGYDVFNSGVIAPKFAGDTPPPLPPNRSLYATLYTKVNGAFTEYQAISFVTGPARGNLTRPIYGQGSITTPSAFAWTTVAVAQNYLLTVGTTMYGSDLVNSGPLPPTQSSFPVSSLPAAKVLYATLYTKVGGTWVYHAPVTFATT